MAATGVGLAMFGVMLALMALRVPIAAAMFVPGALGYVALSGEASFLNLIKGSAAGWPWPASWRPGPLARCAALRWPPRPPSRRWPTRR